MLEYAFFHQRISGLFLDFVKQRGISAEVEQEELGIIVQIPEELDDQLLEKIEAYYDKLLDMTEELVNADEEHIHNVGIAVNLTDGRSVLAEVEPALVNKLLDVISMEELNDLVNAVVDAVENPDERPLCKR